MSLDISRRLTSSRDAEFCKGSNKPTPSCAARRGDRDDYSVCAGKNLGREIFQRDHTEVELPSRADAEYGRSKCAAMVGPALPVGRRRVFTSIAHAAHRAFAAS